MTENKNYKFREVEPGYNKGIKTGKPPGSLIYVGEKKVSVPNITAIQYKDSEVIEFTAATVQELSDRLKPGYSTWINIDGIHDSRVINDVGQCFGLENLSL